MMPFLENKKVWDSLTWKQMSFEDLPNFHFMSLIDVKFISKLLWILLMGNLSFSDPHLHKIILELCIPVFIKKDLDILQAKVLKRSITSQSSQAIDPKWKSSSERSRANPPQENDPKRHFIRPSECSQAIVPEWNSQAKLTKLKFPSQNFKPKLPSEIFHMRMPMW